MIPPSDDLSPQEALRQSRRDFEDRWRELREAARRETGWSPKGLSWSLVLVAAAGGVALAYGRRHRDDRMLPGD